MNKSRLAAVALIVALAPVFTASAQATQKSEKAKPMMDMGHEGKSGWKELDAFHALMAASWHPAAKSNDLKPARERAVALSEAAQAWVASATPAACDNKKIHDAMTAVASGSKAIAQTAAKQSDAELKTALHDLHAHFEVVEMGCHPTSKK